MDETQYQFSVRKLFVWVTIVAVIAAAGVGFGNAVTYAQRQAFKLAAQEPLNQIALAFHNYHEHYGVFPPAYVADSSGKRLHSWRALILPYIEQRALHDAYDFSEPWDGPNNSKLLDQMPTVFGSPTETRSNRYANIIAITGPGTAFPGVTSTCLSDFVDGPEDTLLLSEITNSNISWLEPRDVDVGLADLHVGESGTLGISSVSWRQPYVVFADTLRAFAVRRDTPSKSLQSLATIAGQEPLTRQQLTDAGFLQ